MKKIYRYLKTPFSVFSASLSYIWQGFKKGKGLVRIHRATQLLYSHLFQYQLNLKTAIVSGHAYQLTNVFSEETQVRMSELARGLHSLLPEAETYRYSILIPVENPNPRFFSELLRCALNLSAPNKEILIGFNGEQNSEINEIVSNFEKKYPDLIKRFKIPKSPFCLVFNKLAEESKGNFLLLVDPEGWIRPDLLYRYEQTLRLEPEKDKVFVYALEANMDDEEILTDENSCTLGDQIHVPYFFFNFTHVCPLISKNLWNTLKGFREGANGAHLYDLILRANNCQARFVKIPTLMSARRKNLCESVRKQNAEAAVKSLKSYLQEQGIDWEVAPGYNFHSVRAIPAVSRSYRIHAIIPFKDQKKLTLKAVKSLLSQQNVNVHITAIDNGSKEKALVKEMEKLGVEVIAVDEPFNFSRLNNLALKYSKRGNDSDLLLFMNNDVELENNALFEMCRWIDQPKVGMVGCRLHYPDGLLQCGGIDINKNLPKDYTGWDVFEKNKPFEELDFQLTLRPSDGVNGACLLIKKALYTELGGFDEIWYPIAQSDTNFSLKIQKKGLLNFYTPFACGIHHETATRVINPMEDYENSPWLQGKYFAKNDGG